MVIPKRVRYKVLLILATLRNPPNLRGLDPD